VETAETVDWQQVFLGEDTDPWIKGGGKRPPTGLPVEEAEEESESEDQAEMQNMALQKSFAVCRCSGLGIR